MKKDIFLVILVLVLVGLLVWLVVVSERANKATKSLEEERYSCMSTEESLQRNAAKLVILQAKLKMANQKMLKIQDVVEQQKAVNIDLQKQYDDLNKIKTDLEAKLKALEERPTPPPLSSVTTDSSAPPAGQ